MNDMMYQDDPEMEEYIDGWMTCTNLAHSNLTYEFTNQNHNDLYSNKVTITLRVKYLQLRYYLMVENLVSFSLNLNKGRSGV